VARGRYAIVAEPPGHPSCCDRRDDARRGRRRGGARSLAGRRPFGSTDLPEGPARRTLAPKRLEVVFPLRSATGPSASWRSARGPAGGRTRDADCELGAGLVAQAVVALENAWHLREVLEKKQIERELALAAEHPAGALPGELPRSTAATSRRRTARRGRWAATTTTRSSAALARPAAMPVLRRRRVGQGHRRVAADEQHPGDAARAARPRGVARRAGALHQRAAVLNTPGNKYVTAILLAVDPRPATAATSTAATPRRSCCALRRRGRALPATGLALGLFPGCLRRADALARPGDVVALYSDGVTEAQNADEEEFGNERLVDVAAAHGRRRSRRPRIVSAVLSDIDAFAAARRSTTTSR
jgi:phosphoserine phosphatase RsbU/P